MPGNLRPQNVRNRYRKSLVVSFEPLNLYFWVHLIGFEHGLDWKRNYRMKSMLSIILAVCVEILSIHTHIQRFRVIHISETKISKSSIAYIISYILELMLRILMYMNRKKLNPINRKLIMIYDKATAGQTINLKFKLISVLIANDIIKISLILIYCNFKCFFSSRALQAIIMFLSIWTLLSDVMPIIFCYYCQITLNILREIKKKLFIKKKVCVQKFYFMYDEFTETVAELNDLFQPVIFITFSSLLTWIFYDSYTLIFQNPSIDRNNLLHLVPIITIIIHFVRFVVICYYSSLVTKNACEVRDKIFSFSCYATSVMLKNHNKFVGFTVLDSIVINKSLILASVGTLVTYGMLIATFSANSA